MNYVLGIDQGGTKTVALISDTLGNFLGVGFAGAGNYAVTGIDDAMSQVKLAVDKALDQAGVKIEQCIHIVGGISGADFPFEYTLIQNSMAKVLNVKVKTIKIVNDCMIAMRAATTKNYGAVICAGTGLNCGVKAPNGESFIFGYYIDDEYQGGSAIGKKIMQSVFESHTGVIKSTTLTSRVLANFNKESIDELLIDYVNKKIDMKEINDLVHLAIDCAEKGDMISNEILKSFGENSARFVIAGLKRFDMLQEEVEVVISGSIFKCRLPIIKTAFEEKVRRDASQVIILDSRYEPIVGAIIMALEEFGEGGYSREVENNLNSSVVKCDLLRL